MCVPLATGLDSLCVLVDAGLLFLPGSANDDDDDDNNLPEIFSQATSRRQFLSSLWLESPTKWTSPLLLGGLGRRRITHDVADSCNLVCLFFYDLSLHRLERRI